MKNRILILTTCLVCVILLLGCATGTAKNNLPHPIIDTPLALKVAIVPISIDSGTITLPSSGQINFSSKFYSSITRQLEKITRNSKLFSETILLNKTYLSASPSAYEICQAAKENDADIALAANIIELESKCNYGFRPSLSQEIVMEITIYETKTAARIWHGKERTVSIKNAPVGNMSEKQIISNNNLMLLEDSLPSLLYLLTPKIHSDLLNYKPVVLDNKDKAPINYAIDVDQIPRTSKNMNKKAFAIVIGIENYRDLPIAEFAARDAEIMREYLIRTMGFPEENIVSLIDSRATKGDIEGYIGSWLKNSIEDDSFVIIYFAGHGSPKPSTGEAFIIPFDGNPAFLDASGIEIKKIYSMLENYKTEATLLILDSCFSGAGGRSVIAKGSRPSLIKTNFSLTSYDKLIVMTASKGTEISSNYPEKRHGLFSYFVFKGLQGEADFNSNGIVTLRELYTYISPQVKKISRKMNTEQTPTLFPGIDLLDLRSEMPLSIVTR